MKLIDRLNVIESVFDELENTSSMLDKKRIIEENVFDEIKQDFDFCIEVSIGHHRLGYTIYEIYSAPKLDENLTIVEVYQKILNKPNEDNDHSIAKVNDVVAQLGYYSYFFAKLFNREYKLGIGKSIVSDRFLTPMLAKKFDGKLKNAYYAITEKLDGIRCIAFYDSDEKKWKFLSRNHKPLNVDFNMENFDESKIYDGEILSPEQVRMSQEIFDAVARHNQTNNYYDSQFNKTSGVINSKMQNKDLIYNIFDIYHMMPSCGRRTDNYQSYRSRRAMLCPFRGNSENVRMLRILKFINGRTYSNRRAMLSPFHEKLENVRILPILKVIDGGDESSIEDLYKTLDIVTSIGGEGIMLNNMDAKYRHTRTDDLLKVKKTYSIDMKVYAIEPGREKYLGQLGAIKCKVNFKDSVIDVDVVTGFTDYQRMYYFSHQDELIGKIVEVEYASISKSKTSNTYSLRFPRLKRIRVDKDSVSTD